MNQNWIHANMEHYFQLAGKTAIVTGAGNGIGRGIAQKLAGLGANVVACDIEAESVRNTADEITLAGGVCLGLYCDVRKYEDIQKVVDTAVQKFGTVDILVNDAAGCGGGVTVDTINEQEWMRLIELNLNSVFRFTMTVLPIMRQKTGENREHQFRCRDHRRFLRPALRRSQGRRHCLYQRTGA